MFALVSLVGVALATSAVVGGEPGDPARAVPADWVLNRFEADGFSIWLPPDWRRIPEARMRALNQGAANRALAGGQPSPSNFRCGFQEERGTGWSDFPYIIIDVRSAGRIPWRELREIPRAGGAPGVLASIATGQCRYDPTRAIMWMHFRNATPDGQAAVALTCVHLTQKGVVQINGYVAEGRAQEFRDLFERIATSVQLVPEVAYRTFPLESWPLLDRLDWGNPLMRYAEIGIAASLLGGLIAIAAALYKAAAADQETHPLAHRDHGDE